MICLEENLLDCHPGLTVPPLDRQLFLYSDGEAVVLKVLLGIFQPLWLGKLSSIEIVKIRETKKL